MALTNPLGIFRNFRVQGGMLSRQAMPNVTFRPNSLCFAAVGSEHAQLPLSTAPNPEMVVLGCYEGLSSYTSGSTTDNTGGALNPDGSPAMVQIRPGIADGFATGSGANQIAIANVDQPCFAFDDTTVYLTDLGGTLPFAGFVDTVAPTGTNPVTIRMGEDQRVLYEIFSAAGAPGAAKTQDDTVAGVITNLPTGTWNAAGNVFTVTATGAMPTQDANITTITQYDKFIFPAGTLTTQAVTAAQSGVYECTTAGVSGVKAVWTRTAKFAEGAVITPKTRIKVGANASGMGAQWGGTDWSTRPATTGLLVGTGDPQLVPDKVTLAITLVASTKSITSVPINANTPVGVYAELTGGTPIAGTVGYGTLVAPTVGGVGTGTVVVDAIASGMANTGTTDVATLNVTITQ